MAECVGIGGGSIGLRSGTLRLGIAAVSTFEATLNSDQAMALYVDGGVKLPTDVIIDARVSHPLEMTATSDSKPMSDLFLTEGKFSSPSEDFWGTVWAAGANDSDPLINNYQHSETPVKYLRLDDVTLEYTGDRLTRVTKEEGDDKVLEYTGDLLTRVTDSYTDTIKDLSYTGTQLTGVTVSKVV